MGISSETLKKILEQKSVEYNELQHKYKILEDKYSKLQEEYDYLYKCYFTILEEGKSKHNERGAGRKATFTNEDVELMKMYSLQGKSTRDIAKIFDCSHTTVNKLIKCCK